MRTQSPRRVFAFWLAYAVVITAYILAASHLPEIVRDVGRFLSLCVSAAIIGAWSVIMRKSWREYRAARQDGGDADLRLHIWLISTSYLGYVISSSIHTANLIGKPFEVGGAPTALFFGPLGLYALWLFLRPGRMQTIRPDERSTSLDHGNQA